MIAGPIGVAVPSAIIASIAASSNGSGNSVASATSASMRSVLFTTATRARWQTQQSLSRSSLFVSQPRNREDTTMLTWLFLRQAAMMPASR
jgi:hypothetical protein